MKKIPEARGPEPKGDGPLVPPKRGRSPRRRARSTPGGAGDGRLSRLVLDRLIRYFWRVAEFAAAGESRTITSRQLGAVLNIDPSQIRRDFGAVGLAGMSHVGYDMCEVCRTIRTAVGFDRPFTAVLIGAGNLGRAILSYPGFRRYGLQIVAAFDNDPAKAGQVIAGHAVQPMENLRLFLALHEVRLAILTTPAEVSQGLVDLLVPMGIRAIWNFTPTRLVVPQGVLTRNEHISVGLSEIAYHINFPPPGPAPDPGSAGEELSPEPRPPGPSIPG